MDDAEFLEWTGHVPDEMLKCRRTMSSKSFVEAKSD